MTDGLEIRESVAADAPGLERLYPAAFPDEDLVPLLRDLLAEGQSVLSLVAESDGKLAGHVIFTECGLAGEARPLGLLGPLAVEPARQKQGIGSALVREGFERMRRRGATRICVLGDPAYYSRCGFRPEYAIETPCAIPDEWRDAWQSLDLENGKPAASGRLIVPQVWLRPELWAS